MTLQNRLVVACVCALAAWMPVANAQLHSRQETRSGVLEFEASGYPTAETVERVREEIDYQRAVQAYIHFVPAVGMMPWRNAICSRCARNHSAACSTSALWPGCARMLGIFK